MLYVSQVAGHLQLSNLNRHVEEGDEGGKQVTRSKHHTKAPAFKIVVVVISFLCVLTLLHTAGMILPMRFTEFFT